MARIRTIKPEFWVDESIVELSFPARLLFIGLWNFADDEGRLVYSPKKIKMQIFPADSVDISALIGEIEGESLITIYVVDSKEYMQINSFAKHQKIDKRANSKLPSPPVTPNPPESQLRIKEGIKDQGSRIKESLVGENKFSDDDVKLSKFIFKKIQDLNPNHKEPNFDKWSDVIRLMRERDNRTHKEIQDLFIWANGDEFWSDNILSPSKLREQWDKLTIKKNKKTRPGNDNAPSAGSQLY